MTQNINSMKRMDPMATTLHFLINPAAGNGKSLRVWRRIRPLLEQSGVRHAVRMTASPGEAAEFCRQLAADRAAADHGDPFLRDIVVVIGGDGTLREAALGLLPSVPDAEGPDARLPALSFIPAGSGNDFARGHGIPLDPVKALSNLLDAVREGRSRRIDVIRSREGGTALSSYGAGLDAAVAVAVNRSPLKRLLGRIRLGRLAYVCLLVRVLAAYRPADAVLHVDGERHLLKGIWLASVSNIPSYGGGMRINPDAVPDDGLLDVCVVQGITRMKLLTAFPRVYSGSHTSIAGVSFFRGRRIRLEPASPLAVHADGEDAGMTPFDLRAERSAVEIVV
jgi:YegS/Rv2252/BmrU family lipid kinase